jgi:hypothetical protein
VAGICTAVTRDSGGDCMHLSLTAALDGESITIQTGENDPLWGASLSAEEKRQLLKLLARWWKAKGHNLASFVGRVLAGEEGTNMRIYPIITKDITRTNVGTAYVNVAMGANGERKYASFVGCTQARVRLWANLVGTGPFGFRLIRDGDNEVLFENASIALTGERELDTDWFNLPAAFLNQTNGTLLRLQVKSNVAGDDPVIRGCDLGVQ